MVGPALAGLITETAGWRWVFGGVAVLATALGAVLTAAVRGATATGDTDPAPREVMVPALACSAAVLALQLSGSADRAPAVTVALVAGALVVLGPALVRQLPSGTFRLADGAPRLVVLRGLLAMAAYAADLYLPAYLQGERHVRPLLSGLLLVCSAVGWAAGAWGQARVARTVPGPVVLRAATVVCALGLVVVVAVVAAGAHWLLVAPGLALMGLGMGAAYPQVSTLALAATPAGRHARVGSALLLSETVSVAVVTAVVGLLLAHGLIGWPGVYAVLLGTAVLAALVAGRPTRAARAAPPAPPAPRS